MPKRCSQTKLMDSSDILNKLAVNSEVSQAEVHLPYIANHLRSSSGSGSSSNSPHYGRPTNRVSWQRDSPNHWRSASNAAHCRQNLAVAAAAPVLLLALPAGQWKRSDSCSSGNSGSCSGSSSCSSRSVISSWSRDHNVQLAPNNCLWPKRRPNSLTNTNQQHHNNTYTA